MPVLDGAYTDPERWQTRLPMPYRMVDEVLTELVDDVLLRRSISETALQELVKPAADSLTGVLMVVPHLERPVPVQLAGAGANSLLATISEGIYAVAFVGGGLWLWDAGTANGEGGPLLLSDVAAGMEPLELLCVVLPQPTAPPLRRRLVLLSAKPHLSAASEPAAAGMEAELHVIDLSPPEQAGGEWRASAVASFRLACSGNVSLSCDGRFCACVLGDGTTSIYHLPLPSPVIAVMEHDRHDAVDPRARGGDVPISRMCGCVRCRYACALYEESVQQYSRQRSRIHTAPKLHLNCI